MKYTFGFILIGVALSISAHAGSTFNDDGRAALIFGIEGGAVVASDANDSNESPKGQLMGVYTGLRYSPQWSVRLGLHHWGDLSSGDVTIKNRSINGVAQYHSVISGRLNGYGQIGVAYWDMEKQRPSATYSGTGFSPLLGAGVEYQLTDSLALGAGYQFIYKVGNRDTSHFNSHGLMLNITYTHGGSIPVQLAD